MFSHASCEPFWYSAADPDFCPYGYHLPGDVTVPNDAGVAEMVAVAYSLLLFVILALVSLEFLCRRGTRQLLVLVFCAACVGSNELLVKPLVSQPRPGAVVEARNALGKDVGSCNRTCGMPSSHATLSIGLLTVLVCCAVYRVVPWSHELGGGGKITLRRGGRHACWFLSTHSALGHCMSRQDCVVFCIAWSLLLLPIPLSRVSLYDHTADQVFVGSVLGCIYGCAWFRLVLWLLNTYQHKLGRTMCCGLVNNDYRLPKFHVNVDGESVHDGAEIVEASSDSDVEASSGSS